MCKVELPCKEGRIVKLDPTLAIGTDVRIVNNISWDKITSLNILVQGRQFWSQLSGVGGVTQE